MAGITTIVSLMSTQTANAFGEVNANLARAAIMHLYMSTYAATHLGANPTKEYTIRVLKEGKAVAEEAFKL